MGTVILHVGMSKTGSSSIQRWLGENVDLLRERSIYPSRITRPASGPITVGLAEPGRARSHHVLATRDGDDRVVALRQLVEQLDLHASRYDTIVVTNEGFELLLQEEDARLRAELDGLARVHRTKIVYYVRPQHTWLEAAWRQWGFRHPQPPSEWLRRQDPKLRYLEALHRARLEAPSVTLDMRPCRPDLLEGGEVVSDFATGVLGLDHAPPLEADEGWSNRGFPLDLSILLRGAPRGLFWSSLHDNDTLDRMKKIAFAWQVAESDSIGRSRLVLQRYCCETYEPDNRALIHELGWPTRHFVPPLPTEADANVDGELTLLDDLWRSKASESERELIFCVFEQLLAEAG